MQRYVPNLSDAEVAAYAAPFSTAAHRAGLRRFPFLVMTDPDVEGVDISKTAARWFGSNWRGDSFMAVGLKDVMITPALMERMHQISAIKRPALMLPEVGHFVQEYEADVAHAALAARAD
jgi:haloalkane dehalogenase